MAAWKARPLGALAVRTAILVVPIVAGMGTAVVLSRALAWPEPGTVPWWVALFTGSTVVSLLVGRAARLLLPLAALLRLSLVFPDRTPSRFRVALRTGGVGRLRRQVERIRAEGVGDDLNEAVETVLVLAAALNTHDPLTRGHSERVRALAEMLAVELRLPAEHIDRLRWSALLHDCGKLTIHPDVLHKTDPLTEEDWEALRRHPEEGAKLTAPLRGWLGPWAAAIEEHHERWDGQGYPNGLAGEDLSFGARIVAVADAYEVMTAARSYKTPLTSDEARAELAAQAGRQFDPDVVRAFLRISLGRAGWLAGPLSWLGGLTVIRQIGARVPHQAAAAGLTGAAVAVAGGLGAFAIGDPAPPPARTRAAVVAPAEEITLVTAPPAETPAVLGVQVTRPASPAQSAPSVTRRAPATTTTTTVAPAVPPPASVSEVCTDQAQQATADTPASARLNEIRAKQDPKTSGNPNCQPVAPGS